MGLDSPFFAIQPAREHEHLKDKIPNTESWWGEVVRSKSISVVIGAPRPAPLVLLVFDSGGFAPSAAGVLLFRLVGGRHRKRSTKYTIIGQSLM